MDSRRVADRYQRAADAWKPPLLGWGDIIGPAVVGLLAGWVMWPLVLG